MSEQTITASMNRDAAPVYTAAPGKSASIPANAPAVTVAIATAPGQLQDLRADWQGLFDASPAASAPLRWEWVSLWWSIYGPIYSDKNAGLRIFQFRKNQRLIGLLPLYESRAGFGPFALRRLRFISTGAQEFEETCAEYLNLLHLPGEDSACMDALANFLSDRSTLRWDELVLQDMPEESPLVALQERLAGGGRKIVRESPGVCYISDMSQGMEAYLAGLSTTTRRKARKLIKILPNPEFKHDVAVNAEQADEIFQDLVRLHRKRWESDGHTGSFAPRHLEFHRGLAMQLTASGQVMLARLKYNGQLIACSYGHRIGNRYEGYQLGIDHNAPGLKSAGTGLHMFNMQHLMSLGVDHYDQLAGYNRNKLDYAKLLRPLASLTITRPSIRASLLGAAKFARRAARKLANQISGRKTPKPRQPQPAQTEESTDE